MANSATQRSGMFTRIMLAIALVLGVVVTTATGPATAGSSSDIPFFSKVFQPDVIGPGSTSTLTFTIDAVEATMPATELAFTDTLPAGLVISDAPAVRNTCGGTVTAPAGGTTISLAEGGVGAGSSCQVEVNVTDSTGAPGVRTNTSGDLTSSAGNSGTATDDLTVAGDRPGFSKSFSPGTVAFGGRSTLTFLIDNTAGAELRSFMTFTDQLPPGMTVAGPANVVNTCGGTVTAAPGSGQISLSDGTLAAAEFCTISVDVVGGAVGALQNVSGELTSLDAGATLESSGKASATLDVAAIGGDLEIRKEFTDDPVAPGGVVTLQFTITNRNRDFAASDIGFSDDLAATLSGLQAESAVSNTCGGMATSPFPTGNFEYAGGSLAAEATCTIVLLVSVPADAPNGAFANTTSNVTGTVDGSAVLGNQAGDTLFVTSFPLLTKEFTDDPVGAGDTVTVQFTITNPEDDSVMTDIAFTDVFDEILPTSPSGAPAPGFCGGGSTATFTPLTQFDPPQLSIDGASLAAAGDPGDSCVFSIVLDVVPGAAGGVYPNTTSEVSGRLDDFAGAPMVTGPPATDDLIVVAAPQLAKEFTDDPVTPGSPVTLTFTLQNLDPDNGATDIEFTDDLETTLSGLTATSVDFNDCGATVDIVSDPSLIQVFGGTLAADASCTITLTLAVPAGTAGGTFPNETSVPTATVAGVTASAAPATDDLVVTGLVVAKDFVDDPVIAGGTVDLTFTIDNESGADANAITFKDDLAVGLTPNLPVDTSDCGAGSSLNESDPAGPVDSRLTFAGGELLAGESCTFTVTLDVDPAMADDTYPNATFEGFALIGGVPATLAPATDTLVVDSSLIGLTKQFTDDPATPSGTVTLQFTVENLSTSHTIVDIDFDDDLGAALSGLTVGSVDSDDCGGTPGGVGTGLFTYNGGTLAPGATCTIVLTLDVPAGPFAGNTFLNTTTTPSGAVGALTVTGNAASDTLRVDTVTFTKSFDGPTTATGTAQLTFEITNLNSAAGVSSLSFLDNLGNVIPGMFATGLPATPCGPGSSLSGASVLTLTGGDLGPGGSCSFAVTVNVPGGTAAGDYPNTTSNLTSAGLFVADPATDTLTIEPAPTFAKAFAPNPIVAGDVSTLTFTIDNSASALAASNLDVTDGLPAGVVIATPSNAGTTCTGGTLTAPDGGGTISYTGGEVAAGDSCTIDVDVTSDTAGNYDNVSGSLTSTSGDSGTAADTLVVTPPPPPVFSKVFDPDAITEGDTSTLTFTIDNTAALVPATDLDFTDTLPVEIVIATPSGAATTCVGGTLTAPDGGGAISYTGGTVGAGDTCTIDVDVTSDVAGAHDNVSGDLTSSSGSSGQATGTLNVGAIPPTFSKAFDPDTVTEGEDSTLTFTIDNTASANDATGLDFTDVLPAGVVVATPSNKAKTCTDGMVDAPDGGAAITYSGGTVAAGATCTVTVDVTATTVGDKDNVSGDLTSSSGNSGTAADTLTVTAIPPDFSKEFDPDTISEGDTSTLTFTIDNSASTATASDLDFTDDLPAGVVVETPPDATTDCTGGTITAVAGGTSIAYAGGEVAPGAVCTVSVDVTSNTVGEHLNVSDALTSTSGNSGAAADTLTVVETQPFTTVTGKRYADTRIGGTTFDGLFEGAGRRPAGSVYEVLFAGRGVVPADATGVIVNLTSVGSSPPPGFFTAYDCDGLPTASALNYVAGVDVANEIFVPLSDVGSVCVYTFSESHILIDVVGFVQADDTVKLVDVARLAESREGAPTVDGLMAGFGRTTAGSTTAVQVTDRADIPATVKSVIVNVAAVDPDDTSFLSVFPCTPGLTPTTSTINYTAGVNRANQVIAEVDADGEICIYTDTDIDFIVDVYGYVEPDSSLEMFGPERFADTRGGPTLDGQNSGGGPLAPNTTYVVPITGRDSVPLGADVVVANVVAVDPLEDGFLTVTGCVSPTPNVSSLNYVPGVNGANELVVELSATGKICIFTSGATDVIVDVVGYVPAAVT